MFRPARSPRQSPRPNSLSTIPEELLERILALCIDTPEPVSPSHPAGLPGQPRRNAPLLVCKRFLRIATPLFYHTLTLRSARQTQRLYYTLASNPLLGTFARKLVIQSPDVHDVSHRILHLCREVDQLDLLLVDGGAGIATEDDAERIRRFCQALARLDRIRSLTLRKPASTYLTHERPRLMLEGLADAVKYWRNLETLTFAFRLSSTPSTDLLVASVAKAPRLHTVRAMMPTVLNSCFTILSTNQSLRNIELITDETPSGVIFGTGNGLFLKEARKHERLWACIRRGTPTVRARANTYSPPATASPAAAQQQIKPTVSMGSLAPQPVDIRIGARKGSGSAAYPPPPPPPSASAQYAAGYYYASGAGQYSNYAHSAAGSSSSASASSSAAASSAYYYASRGDSGCRSPSSKIVAGAGAGGRRGTR